MNTVVANSIVIAFISSIGAFVIKLIQGYIPLLHDVVISYNREASTLSF